MSWLRAWRLIPLTAIGVLLAVASIAVRFVGASGLVGLLLAAAALALILIDRRRLRRRMRNA